MKQEHQPFSDHSFNSGADSDTEKEFLGSQNTGDYIDMQNGMPTGFEGAAAGVQKIGGEQIVYPNNLPVGTYQCMWEGDVIGKHVEVWADAGVLADSLIRIDGVIVLQSPAFPVTVASHPQVAFSDKANGGEITISSLSFIPMSFNIQDLVDSLISDPTKYFTAFDPVLYQVNLAENLDTLVYVEHVNMGGGGGQPVGDYQYRMRYVTKDGDKTNLSVATPMIPVLENMSNASFQYPYTKTYGGPANPSFNTRYGIKLKFRVTNLFNFDFIEIVRVAWNQGAAIGFNPTPEIVARIAIAPNEISIREYIDPGDQNVDPAEKISDAELDQQMINIEGAKSPRYYDRRLVFLNLKLQSRLSELTFDQIAGSEVHPVIEKLGTSGYGDPWNYVNRRHYTHGERVGLAIQGFDGVFGQFYAQKVTNGTDIQIPNRRDLTTATTETYSYGGTVKAAAVDGTVGQTHEVFDLTNEVAKTDACSFKNIYHREDTGLWGWKLMATINTTDGCDESDSGAVENHGARVDGLTQVYPYYHPYTPVRQDDPDVTGHNYVVNTEVSKASHLIGGNNSIYRPEGMAPNYYSGGMLLAGVDNFPTGMKGFSIVRTDVAGRVLAQGLGMYSLDPAEFNLVGNTKLATKSKRRFAFFAPDIANGIVSPDVINDIINNPLDYSVQFVSPLGFFSEVYNFEHNSVDSDRDRIVDMISYARIIRDETGGQINPMEDVNMGISGADGFRYVDYAKWRNVNQQPPTFNGPDQGNTVFGITSIERKVEGRGSYLELTVDRDIYGVENVGGTTDWNFEDPGMKDFTEPVYIINIVRTGVKPQDADITAYKQCHFQKLESIIGRGNGLAGQVYPLVDERWEDCIPALTSTHSTATTDRHIFIKRATTGLVEQWLNVTFMTPATVATITATIINTGNYLGNTGLYTHTNTNDRLFTIVFDQPAFIPQDGDLILVRYDKTAPIRFWGGDATIGEAIFAPIDRQADAYDDASSTQFAMGIGFPYRQVRMNPRHYIIRNTGGVNRIQDEDWAHLGYLRQLCTMFTVESRGAMCYSHGRDYPLQFFPQTNYVMRPNRWDNTKTAVDQNIYQNYVDDYGEVEVSQWKWGGFRFRQNINPEYSNEPQKRYFSAPEFGFEEELDQPYMWAWSMPRASNVQNTPGTRTFPANNVFILEDNMGEGKFAYSAITEKGDNLYAFTDKGTCLMLTKKSILSDLDGGEIAYMAAGGFIQGQYWLSRSIGMSDEMWRTAAENEIPIVVNETLAQQRMDGLYFANKDSVFLFSNNEHKDIGRSKYYTQLFDAISKVRPGYATYISSVFYSKHQQYWLHIHNLGEVPDIDKTFQYNQKKGRWIGFNKFFFDTMAMHGNSLYACRESETYELNVGNTMNGQNVDFYLDFADSPQMDVEKEFIRIAINCIRTQKPTRIEFYDKDMNLLCFLDPSIGPLYLKWYGRWEQFIPRKTAGNRYRLQNRLVIVRVIYNLATDFKIVMASIQSKTLK
jgi:hypothetical protein